MTSRGRFVAVLAGAAAGFFGGLFGVGGGIVLVPLLTGPLRLTQHQAHGTSLAVILFTAFAAGLVYALHGNVAWVPGLIIGAASIATAPLGARAASRLTGAGLKRAFSLFLVFVAVRSLWVPPDPSSFVSAGGARIAVELAIGGVVGFISGLMGVGGGIVTVPALRLLLGMPQHLAQGTSLLVILGAAGSGTLAHARRRNVAREPVPWLALGAVIAGPFASWWVQRLPQQFLVGGFAVFLIVNAVHGWIRAGRPAR